MPKKSTARRPGSERSERKGKTRTTSMLGSRKSAGTGGAWSVRKLRRKAGTSVRHGGRRGRRMRPVRGSGGPGGG
jgi:hypothetical protein